MKGTATITGAALLLISVPAFAQDQHGAISFGTETGQSDGVAYGFAWNFPAKDAAHAGAMNACMSSGGTNCTQAAWFANGCGALAMDQHGNALGKIAMSQEQAEARALQGCESAAGPGCNIVGSVCTTPDGDPATYSGSESVLPAQVAQTTVTEPADESPASEEPAPLQDAQTEVTGPVDELLSREERILIQHALNALGFDAGPADGVFGPRTLAAIYYWQRASGHETTGQLTRNQADSLVAQAASLAGAEASPEQEEASSPYPDPDATAIADQTEEAAGNVLIFGPESGAKCAAGEATEDGHCWREFGNKPGCFHLDRDWWFEITENWSGECLDGVAHGLGTITFRANEIFEGTPHSWGGEITGEMVHGMANGEWSGPLRGEYPNERYDCSTTFQYVGGKENGRRVYRCSGKYIDSGRESRDETIWDCIDGQCKLVRSGPVDF